MELDSNKHWEIKVQYRDSETSKNKREHQKQMIILKIKTMLTANLKAIWKMVKRIIYTIN
jgi:hypothetical protein